MGREELIACFQDTLEKSYQEDLKDRTIHAIESNRVYKEGFLSCAKNRKEHARIEVYSGTTFEVSKRYCELGKVAVLNFANSEYPGGGVQFGAMAQEECLCRSSNLFACISNQNVFDEYYAYHRCGQNHFYSDRLIYTKDVTVFKDDSLVPQMLPKEEWFNVDVITCAAPYIAQRKYTNTAVLRNLFKKRIKNIFEAAIDNNIDVLVLGAFGCGAFKNPPSVVARAFHEVIKENSYQNAFKQIVFAIKSTTNNAPWEACPNLVAFQLEFCGISSELSKERMSGGTPVAYAYGNPYMGKQISILGDSISTLEGFNPRNYNVFYSGETCKHAGVSEMKDTWWGQVISLLGAELLVNNSWSGSRVSKLPEAETLFPSGCSDERTSGLHMYDTTPDVIIVYLGTNDWGYGVSPESVFLYAYEVMLEKLRKNYPESEICCCTLNTTFMSQNPGFTFPVSHGGVHIDLYNNIIISAANRFGCKLIDLAGYHMAYDSIDGTHPNSDGMKTLATLMLRELDEKLSPVLDCEHGKHNYVLAERNTGYDKYVCTACCKVKHEGMIYMKKKVVKAHIGYSGGCFGKSITLDGSTLTWYNTLTPACPPDPDYDFTQKKIELSDTDVQLLVSELGNVELDECISDPVLDYPAGASYSVFTCTYEDGSEFEYRTRFKTVPAFERLKEILNKRCVSQNIPFIPPNPFDDDTLILIPEETEDNVIKLDPDVTDILYPDILKLLVSSSNKTITLQKTTIEVGRGTECDLNFGNDNKYIARRQATFMFSNGRWYLMDNNSTNGTSINGVNLQPGKKYQLAADDEIVFARYTKLVFYKTPQSTKLPVPPKPAEPIRLGTVVEGKYKLEKIIAVGFHTVYLANVEGENKKVAIKAADISKDGSQWIIKNIKDSFDLHKQIKHPNVPEMIELIETSEYIYLVMDYLEGETLDQIMSHSDPIEPKRAAIIARNIAGILKEMHSLEIPIVCRDVKPSNIIIHNDTDVKMFDFGIATRFYDDGRGDEQVLGTVGYAAPEQYLGNARPQTDIFGLGMTLYYMLTKDDPKAPGFNCKPIRSLNVKVPRELESIVLKCVRANYEERYGNCDELINALNNFINGNKPGLISRLFGKK